MATSAEIANLIAEQGRLAAEGKRRVGQIYGNLFSNIGTTIGNIPAQLQEQKILQANAAIRNQQMQIGQFQLDSAKRAQMGQQVLAKAIQQFGDDDEAIAKFSAAQGFPEQGQSWLEMRTKTRKAIDEASNAEDERQKRTMAAVGVAFNNANTLEDANAAIAILKHRKALPPEVEADIAAAKSPEDFKNTLQPRYRIYDPEYQKQQEELNKPVVIPRGGTQVAGGKVIAQGQPAAMTPTELKMAAADPNHPLHQVALDALELEKKYRAAKGLQAEWGLLNGKPVALSFDPATGKRFDASGEDVTAKVRPMPPASVMFPHEKLTRVEHKGEDGKTVIEYLPDSALKGQKFEKGAGATESNRAASAEAVTQTGNDIIAKLSDPKFAAEVGPVMGRYNSVRDWVGNPPPELSELAGTIDSYSLASMGVHGMRSVQGAELIQKLLNTKHTPESLISAIKGLNKFSEHYLENQGRTVPSPAPKRDKNPFK